tara:strand:+ start:8043 stop:8465 length:423 start_codon:yes stop_codon:yes gene_type:complete
MATITLTAANVRVGASGTSNVGVAGESLTPGDFLYLKAGDGKYWKAVNSSQAEADIVGVALTYASADSNVAFLVIVDQVTYLNHSSAVFTQGKTYTVSDTSGKIFDAADIGSSDYVTVAGVAASTTSLLLFKGTTGGITG